VSVINNGVLIQPDERDDNQLLTIGRRRAGEIAVLRFDCETAEFQQVAQGNQTAPPTASCD
jgi:hypothetical protein